MKASGKAKIAGGIVTMGGACFLPLTAPGAIAACAFVGFALILIGAAQCFIEEGR